MYTIVYFSLDVKENNCHVFRCYPREYSQRVFQFVSECLEAVKTGATRCPPPTTLSLRLPSPHHGHLAAPQDTASRLEAGAGCGGVAGVAPPISDIETLLSDDHLDLPSPHKEPLPLKQTKNIEQAQRY